NTMQADGHRSALMIALCAFTLLSCGDALIKSTGGAWPGTAVALLRFASAAVGLGLILWWREGRAGFATRHMAVHIARGASLAIGSLFFFMSLFVMPLAEATAIVFISPALVTLLSAIIMRERIPPSSVVAIALATTGVALVLRPNVAALGWSAVLPLVSAMGMASLLLLNRVSGKNSGPIAAQFWAAFWCTPFCLIAAVAGQWSAIPSLHIIAPSPYVVGACLTIAVTASISHGMLYVATTRASAARIAPATYIQIMVALLLGAVLFHHWPDWISLAGTICVLAGGLCLWYGAAHRPARVPAPAMGD
ncbi:MAG: DMT family transporter, partial [Sphingopyxis sp.]